MNEIISECKIVSIFFFFVFCYLVVLLLLSLCLAPLLDFNRYLALNSFFNFRTINIPLSLRVSSGVIIAQADKGSFRTYLICFSFFDT